MVDGRPADTLSVFDRGLSYGDGLFETIRIWPDGPRLLGRHLQRLRQGCRRLAIACDFSLLQQEIAQLLAQRPLATDDSSWVLKIVVTRGAGARGYAIGAAQHSRVLSLHPAPDYRHHRRAASVFLCQTRLAVNPALVGIKHLCRLENVLARSENADSRQLDGLMLDTRGYVAEATAGNVFWVINGELYTPALSDCGVWGITRGLIIEHLAPALGLAVQQGNYGLNSVYQADEMLVCNSVMGVVPIANLACHHFRGGPIAMRLQQALELWRDA